MKWFKSPRQVQRFLFTHDQVANVFARRSDHDSATKFRATRSQAFATWAEVTGVVTAAQLRLSAVVIQPFAPSVIPSTTS